MSTIKQVHLNGRGCSGRGVRFRILSPLEDDQLELDAAKELPQGGSLLELRIIRYREAIKRMLVAYTEPGLTSEQLATAKWIKPDPSVLETDWGKIFGPRDDKFLVELYRHYHEVSKDEVEQIVGKVLDVESA